MKLNDNLMLSVIQEEEISLFTKSSEWEYLSEFEGMISDASDDDYCHRNLRQTVLYRFLSYFAVLKDKMN